MSDAPKKDLLPAIDIGLIERQMRERDSFIWTGVGMKLAAGIPLAMAGPFAVAVVLSLEGYMLGWDFNYFTFWFVLACAIWALVAWKFLPRHEGNPSFADEVIGIVSLTAEDAPELTLSELAGQDPRAVAGFIAKTLLGGPRRVYDAWRRIQEYKAFGPSRRQRAAEALQELSRRQTGIPWLDLRRQNEALPELLEILGYLKATEWVDFSGDGRKIWMLSDARKAAMAG